MSARILLIPALCLAGLLALARPVAADPVTDLYAANVAVTDQSAETRRSALQDALAQVLVKVTGSQAVLGTSEAATLLENPSRYLQRYRYETIRPVPVDPTAPRLALHAEFDGATLERRLRAAGLPLWGRERPMTLAWVAFNDTDRQLLAAGAQHAVVDALRRAAMRRGLPLTLPAMDEQDATRLTFMDVWGVFEDPLLAASERYRADAVVAGSVFRAGDDLWAGRWTLLRDGERHRFEVSGPSPEAVATQAIDAIAEHYASEFAVYAPLGGEGRVVMEIEQVDGLAAYAHVQSYLQGLSLVNAVRLLSVDGEQVRFELDVNGTTRNLEQAIALGRTLAPVPVETRIPLLTNSTANDNATPDTEPVTEPVTEGTANRPEQAEPVQATVPPAEEPQRVLRYRYVAGSR